MKLFTGILFCLCCPFSHEQTIAEINRYVTEIDHARKKGGLKRYEYPNMSVCSGSLYGYYQDKKLVYLDAVYGAEVGYSTKQVYLKDSTAVKISYRQHFGDWDAYYAKYPGKEEFDESKMIYTDTLYTFWIGADTIMYQSSGARIISKNSVDLVLLKRLQHCVVTMRSELAREKQEG